LVGQVNFIAILTPNDSPNLATEADGEVDRTRLALRYSGALQERLM
jgi:hypothetical protein